jgi:uncharacterized protein
MALEQPFHEGERAVQARAGVQDEAAGLGRGIAAALPAQMGRLLLPFRLAAAASRDAGGRVWASLLGGAPGFLHPLDEHVLLVRTLGHPADPLAANVRAQPAVGLLPIDLAARRRLRINGRGAVDEDRGLLLTVEQLYANCPQYIHTRRLEVPEAPTAAPGPATRGAALGARQQQWIAAADTFFIASAHPTRGADASHRGGGPGFVHVLGPGRLRFPDYPGNNMFNTLGNLTVDPRAGLVFPDFAGGGTLQLTGRAKVDWKEGAPKATVDFEIDEVLEIEDAGLHAELLARAPEAP